MSVLWWHLLTLDSDWANLENTTWENSFAAADKCWQLKHTHLMEAEKQIIYAKKAAMWL